MKVAEIYNIIVNLPSNLLKTGPKLSDHLIFDSGYGFLHSSDFGYEIYLVRGYCVRLIRPLIT